MRRGRSGGNGQAVAAGTAPYVLEMSVLMRVLAAQRGAGSTPGGR